MVVVKMLIVMVIMLRVMVMVMFSMVAKMGGLTFTITLIMRVMVMSIGHQGGEDEEIELADVGLQPWWW